MSAAFADHTTNGATLGRRAESTLTYRLAGVPHAPGGPRPDESRDRYTLEELHAREVSARSGWLAITTSTVRSH